ncbi:MAG TPA: hypothetical protein HPQ04_03425 [Rhodospirillaceae bacterium]|nr:hypothetical protein [Rhodospirillaceae bacterium]
MEQRAGWNEPLGPEEAAKRRKARSDELKIKAAQQALFAQNGRHVNAAMYLTRPDVTAKVPPLIRQKAEAIIKSVPMKKKGGGNAGSPDPSVAQLPGPKVPGD